MDILKSNIRDSQNFLHDNKLVAKLISMSSVGENDTVYEIGAGKGIITKGLAATCKKVISIELDIKMAQKLINKFSNISNIEIICADFLRYKIEENSNYKFFSNIPFNITSQILTKVLELNRIQDVYFIMQYEAFLKYSGMPYYKECLKSLLYKPFFTTELIYEFSPSDFIPTPNARIVFVRFYPKDKGDILSNNAVMYRDFLTFLFVTSGQTIKEKAKKIFTYEQLKRTAKNNGFSLDSVISDLSYKQWISLFDIYLKYVSNEKKSLTIGAYKRLSEEQNKLDKLHKNRTQRRG